MEDKLSEMERIRLECLAQAVSLHTRQAVKPTIDAIIDEAEMLKNYVLHGREDA